jgi:Protein of unknown function (DUF2934)
LDIETRRQKRQELMVRMVERKVRGRAEQLYQERGQEDGSALKDWFEAEEEVLANTTVAPLYRRMRVDNQPEDESADEVNEPANPAACESPA